MTTIQDLKEKKLKQQKITALTAYDFSISEVLNEVGIDLILVGDSLGMVVLGLDSTIPVTIDDMIRHTQAVARGATKSLIITDLPFGSYHTSIEQAVENAVRCIRAGANGVKVEGASPFVLSVVKRLNELGILVVGHIGFTPQKINQIGRPKVQGKNKERSIQLVQEGLSLQEVGADLLVLELMPQELAKAISQKLDIPTIGIGSGKFCDGQILVVNDVLGLYSKFTPKFVKKYAHLSTDISKAVTNYKEDVISGEFPEESHSF